MRDIVNPLRFPPGSVLGSVLVLLSLSLVVFLSSCVPKPQQRQFVQKDCLDCHTEFAEKYFKMKNVHKVVQEKKCEDCHLPHGIVPKMLLKQPGNQICYTCHEKDKIGMDKAIVHTALKKGSCTSCHNPHASQAGHLLKAEGNDVCYQCHQKAEFEKKVVHKVMITESCLSCHVSHSADEPNLLKTKEIPLCLSCHDSNQAPFKKAHADYPVETAACNGCHNPHSSTKPDLLKKSVHPLVAKLRCEDCHNTPGSPNPFETRKEGSTLCTECHTLTALRGGGDIEHLPFKEGKCHSCHNSHASENTVLLAKGGNDLCLSCHKDRNTNPRVSHKAVTDGRGCLSCHVRHASTTPKLLLAKEGDLCFSCHEKTKTALLVRKPHKPFSEGACKTCHDPHGSNFYGMMNADMNDICYSCHTEAEIKFTKTNTHKPVVDGVCQACHASHGSDRNDLLLADADDPKLCIGCHADMMKPVLTGSNHKFFQEGRCLKCHDVHGSNFPGMIVSKQGFLCFSCHGTEEKGKDVKDVVSKHAPVVDGNCTSCHNPHKARLQSLLLAGYPDLCLTCHEDLKSKMYPRPGGIQTASLEISAEEGGETPLSENSTYFVHAPDDLKNCQTCHKPHFSNEPDLMTAPIQRLCEKCHDYQKPAFRQAHLNIDAASLDCRKCHEPHASKNPKFFKAFVHKPFDDRACKDCHIVDSHGIQ